MHAAFNEEHHRIRCGRAAMIIAALAGAALTVMRAAGLPEIRATTRALHAKSALIPTVPTVAWVLFRNAAAPGIQRVQRDDPAGDVVGHGQEHQKPGQVRGLVGFRVHVAPVPGVGRSLGG